MEYFLLKNASNVKTFGWMNRKKEQCRPKTKTKYSQERIYRLAQEKCEGKGLLRNL